MNESGNTLARLNEHIVQVSEVERLRRRRIIFICLRFIVEIDGSISQPIILKGLGQECDEQALKLVSSMPRWQPGKKNGDVAPTYKELGIMFKMY